MVNPSLAKLVAARTEALGRHRSNMPWSKLDPTQRATEEKTLAAVTDAERAIMAVLLAASQPVRAGDVVLHLTGDRLHFVELEPGTKLLAHATGRERRALPPLWNYSRKAVAS